MAADDDDDLLAVDGTLTAAGWKEKAAAEGVSVADCKAAEARKEQAKKEEEEERKGGMEVDEEAVSYTHLTLPTICSV
eukprot:11840100-Alexandrium_andersonii.AAC.1